MKTRLVIAGNRQRMCTGELWEVMLIIICWNCIGENRVGLCIRYRENLEIRKYKNIRGSMD